MADHNCLDEVMTFSEVSKIYGIGLSTLRMAVKRGQLSPGDIRKAGGTWLILRSTVEKYYGPLPEGWPEQKNRG